MSHFHISLAAEDQAPEQLAALFIDHGTELSEASTAIFDRNESLLVAGRKGIGKTAFLRRLESLARAREENLLVLRVNLLSGFHWPMSEAVGSSVALELTLLVCQRLWETLFEKRSVDLLESLESADSVLKSSDERRFVRLYRLLKATSIARVDSRDSTLSLELLAKAGTKEQHSRTYTFSGLAASEFSAVLADIMSIPAKLGYTRLVVFCDEANKLPIAVNDQLMFGVHTLLTLAHTQFVFAISTNFIRHEARFDTKQIFDTTIELGPFDRIELFHELIDRLDTAGGLKLSVGRALPSETRQMLWEASQGHPRRLLTLLSDSINEASAHNRAVVEPGIAARAIIHVMQHEEAYVRGIQREFPDFEY